MRFGANQGVVSMTRIIGVSHRVKRTAQGEARPTLVAVKEGKKVIVYELTEEQDELDFLYNKFPTGWRTAEIEEDLSGLPEHHVRKKKDSDEIRVPNGYDGFGSSDVVTMILGGSGDRFAYALSRHGEKIGAKVYRIPGIKLSERRSDASKNDDHKTLIGIYEAEPALFYEFAPADGDRILVSEAHRARREAQVARIGCEQRLRQNLIGTIFLSEEGGYPEGTIEQHFEKLKKTDKVFLALKTEEDARTTDLRKAVALIPIWQHYLKGVTGCGEVLAAGVLAPIGDIRMFATPAKLKAFVGAHVLKDGRFPRKRGGEVANWNPRARQALYLLGDQFVKRADSHWGLKLREYKVNLRKKHPAVECSTCALPWEECTSPKQHKKRYTDGHIHKMAIWRSITRFVEKLHKEWTRLDKSDKRREEKAA